MIQFLIITSAEREVKDCDTQECFKVAFGCPKFASQLVRDIVEFFDLFLFLFITLARNIDCKSILQKTLKQFSLRLTSQTSSPVSCYVAQYVSSKCVLVWLFTVETFSFSPEIYESLILQVSSKDDDEELCQTLLKSQGVRHELFC